MCIKQILVRVSLAFALPLNPKSDLHSVTPNSITSQSNIKVMRVKETIKNEDAFDFLTNSPCQYHRKYMENSKDNIYTYVRM